ncbi:MAG TPA: radical SAM protein [Kofleriaceae bacterium]|nr:radical SAM protein [Kofleriaceae bacterium]
MSAADLRGALQRSGRDARFALGLARRRPFQVLLQITNRCNMTCDFCDFWPNGVPPHQELSLADYQRVARELDGLGTFLVSVEGGEPLVRKDVLEILRAFARRHLVVLYSNGWFVTAELARRIYDAGVAQVGISIDYADAERHDARRGQAGATRRAWEAIDHLRRASPGGARAVHVMTVLMAENQAELPRLLAQSAAHDVGHWITLVSAAGYRRGKGAALPAAPVSAELLRLRARFPHFRVFRDYVAAIDDFLASAGGAGGAGSAVSAGSAGSAAALPTCHAGDQSFNIDHQGGVAPCIEHIDWTAGNVRDEPLADIVARMKGDPRIAGCQACWTVCRGFAQVLGRGGSPSAWTDLVTRMRSW